MDLVAAGSALGTGSAGLAAIRAWKKAYAQNKTAPFILVTFISAPLSQIIYGMILMQLMIGVCEQTVKEGAAFRNRPAMLAAEIFGGLAMGASSWFQGKAGAAACDALGETGQGFGNYLMTIGIVETVALFVLVYIQGAF